MHNTSIEHDTGKRGDVHRWVCSCGGIGTWKPREFQARQGAIRHTIKLTNNSAIVLALESDDMGEA